jgi:disabled homolog 2
MTDSRAFGYIFGSPDCGHRFFGIKTDKAASQVVLAMRDLFQCVFELKKKEIELAKQHIQNRITAHEHQQVKNSILDHKKANLGLSTESSKTFLKSEKSPEASTANLVTLNKS